MRRILLAASLAGVLAGAGACADGYGYRGGVALGYDGYYDDFYGPVYDGYWRNDGYYYYRPGRGRPYVRDDGRHFRRDAFPGGREFRGGPPRRGWFGGRR